MIENTETLNKNYRVLTSLLVIFSLSFSVDSAPLPIKAQIVPLASLLSFFLIPWSVTHLIKTPLLNSVLIFLTYAIAYSLLVLLIELSTSSNFSIAAYSFLRQAASLFAGISVFLFIRKVTQHISDHALSSIIIFGFIPPLAISLSNIIWGLTGCDFFAKLVIFVRSNLVLYSEPGRVSGVSLEPSTFSFYMAVIVIPLSFVLYKLGKNRTFFLFLFFISIAVFISCFSGSGFVVLGSMMLGGVFIFKGLRKYFISGVFLILIVIFTMFFFFQDNYMVKILKLVFGGDITTYSLVDAFYGSFSPLITIFSSYSVFGYGLGGTALHFKQIVPGFAQQIIASGRWQDMPNLTSLTARVFSELGIVGFLLFFLMFLFAFRQINVCFNSKNGINHILLIVAKLALIGAFVGHVIKYGSFAMPYLWFWFAVIDSRYIKIISNEKRIN